MGDSKKEIIVSAILHLVPLLAWIIIPFGALIASHGIYYIVRRQGRYPTRDLRDAKRFYTIASCISVIVYVITFIFLGPAVLLALILLVVIAGGVAIKRVYTDSLRPYPVFRARWLLTACVGLLLTLVAIPVAFNYRVRHTDIQEVTKPIKIAESGYAYEDPELKLEPWFPYAEVSAFVYRDGDAPSGWKWTLVKSFENRASGFYGEAYKYRDGSVVIAYRGTEGALNDLLTDWSIAIGLKPKQFDDAEKMYKLITSMFPGKEVQVAGHSLGGAMAQFVASKYVTRGYTFNAFGSARFLTREQRYRATDRVFNVVEKYDVVSCANYPFTLSGVITVCVDFTTGRRSNHSGCVLVYMASYKRYDMLLWHSAWQVVNDLIFYDFAERQYDKVTGCPPPIATWKLLLL